MGMFSFGVEITQLRFFFTMVFGNIVLHIIVFDIIIYVMCCFCLKLPNIKSVSYICGVC
jgi:hypothetical protein